MAGKSRGVVDRLKHVALTILASCLSGLEDIGRDGGFSSYSLLLEEKRKEVTLSYNVCVCLLLSLCLRMNVLA